MSEQKKLLLRINKNLWERINQWAQEDFRSVNSQIEFLLKDAVRKKYRSPDAKPTLTPSASAPNDDSSH